MEKFSKFNDPRTGVNPFTVPDFSPTVLGAIGGLCIAAVRLPIFIIVAACVVASDAISTKVCAILPTLMAAWLQDSRRRTLSLWFQLDARLGNTLYAFRALLYSVTVVGAAAHRINSKCDQGVSHQTAV